jgi:hypothetical protein
LQKTDAPSAENICKFWPQKTRFSKKHDFSNFRQKPVSVHEVIFLVIAVNETF